MSRRSPRQRSLFGGFSPAPRDPRGRKAIQWDSQVAEKVSLLAARGRTKADIAELVELSAKTLNRIYAVELERGAELIRDAIFESQVRQAIAGKTPAAKFVEGVLTKGDADAFAARFGEDQDERRSPQPARLGKKEAAQLAAATAGQGSDWGDDLLGPKPH